MRISCPLQENRSKPKLKNPEKQVKLDKVATPEPVSYQVSLSLTLDILDNESLFLNHTVFTFIQVFLQQVKHLELTQKTFKCC